MAAKFKRTNSFSTAKADGNNKPKLEDLLQVHKLPTNGEWVHVRFIGPICSYAYHWFEIAKKDGGKTRLPKLCLNYDSATESHDMTKKCPYCAAGNDASKTYFSNAIIRSIEEAKPSKLPALTDEEEETGFKQDGSKSWTPVRVLRLSSSVVQKLQKLTDLNFSVDKTTKKRRTHDIADPRYGIDIFLSEDAGKKGTERYGIQKDNRTPLDEEQREYLVFDIEDRHYPLLESVDEATRECKSLVDRAPEDDEDSDYKKKPRPSAGKQAKKSPVLDDDELDLDDEDEPKPKKKKPRPAEDEYDLEDEPKPAKKKRPPVDEDEDDDYVPAKKKKPADDFDLDDEDEDEPKPAKKKRPVEDFDLDEEDEEPKPKKKKSRPVEDEDEEEVPRKKKPKPPVDDDDEDDYVPAKKKKPADDFDLDDDLDD